MSDGVFYYASARGRRRQMEDRGDCWKIWEEGKLLRRRYEGWFCGIADGHGGDEAASYCISHLAEYFPYRKERDRRVWKSAASVERALAGTVSRLNEETRHMRVGTTLSVACIIGSHKRASFAVLGDSPVIVVTEDGLVRVSALHNVGVNDAERKAAMERGGMYNDGYIWNGSGQGLHLSRALGDADMDDIILREPEIFTVENPRHIVMATDGIFSGMEDDPHVRIMEIVELLKDRGDRLTADDLHWHVEHSYGLNDNLFVMVWHAD